MSPARHRSPKRRVSRKPSALGSRPSHSPQSPAQRLGAFLRRFEPGVAALARAALARMRALTPPTHELVYDAYNALSVGFSFSERTSAHFLHVAVYPRHVNIGFPFGTALTDPKGQLQGSGARIRHLTVRVPKDLREPSLAGLVREAAAQARAKMDGPLPQRRRLVVRAVYARQRPRRPTAR